MFCCKELQKYWERGIISPDEWTDGCQYKITIWDGTWIEPVLGHSNICFCPYCGMKLDEEGAVLGASPLRRRRPSGGEGEEK